jgi:SAM-dependent methyltransferase
MEIYFVKKLDTYLDLCTQIYDLSKPTPPEDAYNFYRNYLKNAKGLILEPMCGTGRFLIPFMEEGFYIRGFDASAHMLEALLAKAKLKNLKPNVSQGFVENLIVDSIRRYLKLLFEKAKSSQRSISCWKRGPFRKWNIVLLKNFIYDRILRLQIQKIHV